MYDITLFQQMKKINNSIMVNNTYLLNQSEYGIQKISIIYSFPFEKKEETYVWLCIVVNAQVCFISIFENFSFFVLMNIDTRSVIRCLEIVIKCCNSVANVFHILRIKSLCYCEILAHYFIFIVIQTKAYPCKSRVTICKNFTRMTSERNASLSKKL